MAPQERDRLDEEERVLQVGRRSARERIFQGRNSGIQLQQQIQQTQALQIWWDISRSANFLMTKNITKADLSNACRYVKCVVSSTGVRVVVPINSTIFGQHTDWSICLGDMQFDWQKFHWNLDHSLHKIDPDKFSNLSKRRSAVSVSFRLTLRHTNKWALVACLIASGVP